MCPILIVISSKVSKFSLQILFIPEEQFIEILLVESYQSIVRQMGVMLACREYS